MTPYEEDSAPRKRDKWTSGEVSHTRSEELSMLRERVVKLETHMKFTERHYVASLERIEKTHKEELASLKADMARNFLNLTTSINKLDVTASKTNIVIAEMRVRAGLIGVISCGITYGMFALVEFVKQRLAG